jgi:hypothetical protein
MSTAKNYRWQAIAQYDNNVVIEAFFTKEEKFLCSDIDVQNEVLNMIVINEPIAPLLVLPPCLTLNVSSSNPASVASAFAKALIDVHKSVPNSLTFSGSNFFIPGVSLDDEDTHTHGQVDYTIVGYDYIHVAK